MVESIGSNPRLTARGIRHTSCLAYGCGRLGRDEQFRRRNEMDFGVTGKIAMVTGGGTGIGHDIAKTFHDKGAIVVINGRTKERIDAAAAAIGPRAHRVVADLLTRDGAEKLADYASRLGPVSFLINNIGIFDVNDFFEVGDVRWIEYFEHNIMTAPSRRRFERPLRAPDECRRRC
jgi:hypothetical protein